MLANLIHAIDSGHIDAIKTFLDIGVPINVIEPTSNQTPLSRAIDKIAIFPHLPRQLLELGADPHMKDGCGESPLRKAIIEPNLELLKLLVSYGAATLSADYDGSGFHNSRRLLLA